MSTYNPHQTAERDALAPASARVRDARSASSASAFARTSFASNANTQPGSFNPDVKSTISIRGEGRPATPNSVSFQPVRRDQDDTISSSEQRQAEYRGQIDREMKIKIGSENLLDALHSKNAKQTKDQRLRVESELNATNRKIARLRAELAAEVERFKGTGAQSHNLSRPILDRSVSFPDNASFDIETESPTIVLTELLQALEAEGHTPDYYVERANNLVDLFKRNPTLKYDLVWSIFGARVQSLLLSDNREIVAAGYRVLRHVITDRKSLALIRSLQTDYFVILSLVKDAKASLEREQALKFVRGFLDVKSGTSEISRGIVRVIAAVSQHSDDRLKAICILTLAELMIKDPDLVVSSGGLSVLREAFAERDNHSADGLIHALLYLADLPARRKYFNSGHELNAPFVPFTDGMLTASEDVLRNNAGVIAAMLKSWPGLFLLSRNDFASIRSLLLSLYMPSSMVQDVVLELLFDVLRIKNPSWSSSFLAGRRLTTYGRVATLKTDAKETMDSGERQDGELLNHITAALLSALIHADLIPILLQTIQNQETGPTKRKATLLLSEVLELSRKFLPFDWSVDLQILPSLFRTAAVLNEEDRHPASSAIYQIDSVTRTLQRSGKAKAISEALQGSRQVRSQSDVSRSDLTPQMDETHFRAAINDTGVLSTVNFSKWRWDLVQKIIEGPLLNPKRLEEATKANKFVKRILGFYLPFKYRFSEVRNTKPNQRYVRIGCSLIRTLLATTEGVRYLGEHKFLRQLAECLAQLDRMSGLTSSNPVFAADSIAETLSGGYFAILGVISNSNAGLIMIERWKMVNMFYHIIELPDRDDLIKALLGNMDFTLDSHLRIILSKAMTSGTSEVRVFATRLLRKYATGGVALGNSERAPSSLRWAIQLLVTQLYDPDIEVCEIAIKILEEACNYEESLEFVVRCKPALDHLGEIGAPLLLRFLSSSTGYHYLDGLDYISQEMEDWFLGRNESYVSLVEAFLARLAMSHEIVIPENDEPDSKVSSFTPPHFYRELTRTSEGCRLLEHKGHFLEFTQIIQEHGMELEDRELMLRAKGAMWAVGNIGSNELGAPFLASSNIVDLIVRIAEHSAVLSMRGTAFLVLGLISRSIHGQEILAESGWAIALDEMGSSSGVCLPLDFRKLFTLPDTLDIGFKEVHSSVEDRTQAIKTALKDDDPTNSQILNLINDLNNSVLTKARATELHAIKAKKPTGFRQPQLFHKVMRILEDNHFRLPVLRFVFDLFDKNVLRQIVLDESDSEDEESTLITSPTRA